MLRGLTTVSFWADDVAAAKKWYAKLLGIEPYFERPDSENPAYVEFRFGDYQAELGIINYVPALTLLTLVFFFSYGPTPTAMGCCGPASAWGPSLVW